MTREEAIKAIKAWDFLDNNEKEVLETLIPELKESDERIRTGLINGFKECLEDSQYPKNAQKYWHNIKIEDILYWLQKQGKQKVSTVDWKPSDEQMKLLEELVEDNDQRHFHTLLKSLYEQLKRLKEE